MNIYRKYVPDYMVWYVQITAVRSDNPAHFTQLLKYVHIETSDDFLNLVRSG
jgi:hypothetical protein